METTEESGRWPLPQGWRWFRAKDFATVVGGGTPKDARDPSNYDPEGMPWITPADLSGYSRATIRRGLRSLSVEGLRRSSARSLPEGSVLISSRAPVGYCVVADGMVTTNQGFRSLVLNEGVDPFFIRYYVLASKGYLEDNASGTTFKELPGKALGELLFPVPPLDTQRRIVARIDELFTELDDGEAALARARADLETYRKSLLKAAVTGELTADWRGASPPTETGERLLKRILATRKGRWEADPKNKGKLYKEPEAADTSDLAGLPEGWTWASLAQLAFISGGLTVDKKRQHDDPVEVPYLRVANVQRGSLDLTVVKTISVERAKLDGLMLQQGDILLNEGGDRDKIGRGWVYEGQLEQCVHQNHVFKARPICPLISPYLVSMYLNELGRQFFIDEGKQTTNLASISLTKVSRAPVAVPPLEEANEILRLVAELADGIEQQLGDNADFNVSLRQSILAAAFRGELVQ